MSTSVQSILTQDIEDQLAAAIAAIASRQEVRNVFLTACGGSYALMLPAQYALSVETSAFDAHALTAGEFLARDPKALGSDSVVICCSHSGNTPETVDAARHARERGALTIAFTHVLDSPLAQAAEYAIGYQHGEGKSESYTSAPLLLRLVFALLAARDGNGKLPEIEAAVRALPELVVSAKEAHAKAADAYGRDYKNEKLIYTMAAGSNYGVAYSFAICLLQEMQWIHSQGIHAGEYFHGPFEITDTDVPFIALLGLDNARGMEERAVEFLQRYSDRTLIIDARTFDLSGVAETVRGYVAPLLFSPVLRTYADALADHRGHPLSVRRYMWRMEY